MDKFETEVKKAMIEAFKKTDKEFLAKAKKG